MPPSAANSPEIFTVSQLNREVRLLLEQQVGFVWLEGEISNLSRPASGHWYFSLKDSSSQIRCAMFRNRNRILKFNPQQGEQVLVRGSVSLYEARGDFQLIVEHMEAIGEGALQRKFEQIKKQLLEAGLFEQKHKMQLPAYPQRIGVITSPSGAAIRDVLHVLNRRYPASSIVVYPTLVQGEQAAGQIVKAIETANLREECEVILLVRGGGSLEDLWPFNETQVAYAIHLSAIPIVSGVGHETDLTIADLVADMRAPTPSAAAEVSTPDIREELLHLNRLGSSLQESISVLISNGESSAQRLSRRLLAQHPQRRLRQQVQRIDELEQRLYASMRHRIQIVYSKLNLLGARLNSESPRQRIKILNDKIYNYQKDIELYERKILENYSHRFKLALTALDSVSPLATLNRGYAIIKSADNRLVSSMKQVEPGDRILATLHDGDIHCRVENTSSGTAAKI